MYTPDFPVTADSFIFFGDFLVIDFVNTEIVKRRKRYDLITTPEHLAEWRGAAITHYPDVFPDTAVCDEATSTLVRDYRGTWRAIFQHIVQSEPVSSAALAHVNTVLEHTRLELFQNEGLGFHQSYHGAHGVINDWLLPITQSGLSLLLAHETNRLRHCRNEHCILFFYDNTKNGGREWCSTACMNRARSSAHYQAGKHPTNP